MISNIIIMHRGTFFPRFCILQLALHLFICSIVLPLCLLDKKRSRGRKICGCSSVFKSEIVPHSAFCFLYWHLSFLLQTVVSERCLEKSEEVPNSLWPGPQRALKTDENIKKHYILWLKKIHDFCSVRTAPCMMEETFKVSFPDAHDPL